jgi:outer membrane immunogenic protein
MKRILWAGAIALVAGGQALAADLPPPVAPRAPATYVPTTVPVYNWSGIYIGANGGYAFGTSSWNDPTGVLAFPPGAIATGNFNTNGWLAGGTVGGNVQWGAAVLGIEGDWDWANINGTSGVPFGCVPGGCETKANWLATVRGRAGWAIDRVLLFGTGGAAFAPVQAGFPVAGTGFSSTTQVGWTAGAGLEFAFAPNWTAKAEYLYADLGNSTCTTNCFGNTSVKFTENIVRAGINFKFNPW